MQNEEGERVDLYIPRKCSATNKIITADDHGSIQINIGQVDENGVLIRGKNQTYAISGSVRNRGDSDAALNRLASRDAYMKNVCPKNTFFG